MKVFVTGATSAVGRALVPNLIKHGHEVIGLARTTASSAMLHAMHAQALLGQGRDVMALAEAIAGTQAIVHLASSIPTSESASEDEWRPSPEVTTAMLRYLVEASARTRVRTCVFVSSPEVYSRENGDAWITEDSTLAYNRYSQPYLEAEDMLLTQTRGGRVAGIVLRFGLVYGPDLAKTRGLLYALRNGLAPLLGNGEIYWPQLHVQDAAEAIRLALTATPSGQILNVCDDEPVTQQRLYSDLSRWIGGPPPVSSTDPYRPRTGGLRLVELTHSVRMSNARAKDVLGFYPQYATYREGYTSVIREVSSIL